jgi:hypothetical protein
VAVAVLNGAVGVPVTSAATIRAGTRSMPCELIAWPFASRQRLLCGGGHEEATEFCETRQILSATGASPSVARRRVPARPTGRRNRPGVIRCAIGFGPVLLKSGAHEISVPCASARDVAAHGAGNRAVFDEVGVGGRLTGRLYRSRSGGRTWSANGSKPLSHADRRRRCPVFRARGAGLEVPHSLPSAAPCVR